MGKWIGGTVAVIGLISGLMAIFGVGPISQFFKLKLDDVEFMNKGPVCAIESADDLLLPNPKFCDQIILKNDVKIDDELIIVANEIDLGGYRLRSDSRITIFARTIRNGEVNGDGDNGSNNGTAGANGSSGTNAAQIDLIVGELIDVRVSANGGDGGDGVNGSRGSNGRNGRCGAGSYRGAQRGGTGGSGGDAGRGGGAGDINIHIFSASSSNLLKTVSSSGENGLPGNGGPGGKGGKGCTGLGGSQRNERNGDPGPMGNFAIEAPQDKVPSIVRENHVKSLKDIAICVNRERDRDLIASCFTLLAGASND